MVGFIFFVLSDMKLWSTWGKPIERAKWLRSLLERSTFVLLLLLIIGLRAQWEQVIAKVFVKSIFSHFDSSFELDLGIFFVFTLTVLLGAAFLWDRKQKVKFGNWDWIIIFILLAHLAYRLEFLAPQWQYTPTYLIPAISYMDLLILGLAALWITKWVKKWRKRPTARSVSHETIKLIDPDAPILSAEDSISTQRNQLARDIANRIHHFRPQNQAFAIGIEGAWGSGKTSIWNLVKHELNQTHEDPDRVIIEFTPWYFNDVESLLASFFKELERESKSYDPNYARMLAKYGSKISKAEKSFLRSSYSSYFLNWVDKSDSLMDQRDRISDRIKDWNRKYVIFIDDLDRLGKDEVIAVLRLVRLCANFAHTIFVVAFDRGYVEEAVKDLNPHNYTGYMEKVFQQIFSLPAYHDEHLVEALESSLGKLIPPEYQHLEQQLFADIHKHRPIFLALLTNIRDVKRLANSFFFAMNTLWNEASPTVMLLLELVRQKHRPVYNWYYRMSLVWAGLSHPATPSGRVEKGWEQMLKELSDKEGFPLELVYHFKDLAEFFNNHPQGLTIPQYHRKYFSFYLDDKTDLSGIMFRQQFDLKMVLGESWQQNLDNWLQSGLDWTISEKEAENRSISQARKEQLLNELGTMPKGAPTAEAAFRRAFDIAYWIEEIADTEKKYIQSIDYLLRYMKPIMPLVDAHQLQARKILLESFLLNTPPLFMASRSLRLMLKPFPKLSSIKDGHSLYTMDEVEALLQQILEKATQYESWDNYVKVREDIEDLAKDKLDGSWKSEKLVASLEQKIRHNPKDFYAFILVDQARVGVKPDMDKVRDLFKHGEEMQHFLQELDLTDRASKEFQEFWQIYMENGRMPVSFGFAEIKVLD